MRRPSAAGKRWIAGFAQHTATKSSTSIAAMRAGVEVAEAAAQRRRAGERPLHRHLLVEQHADQQRRAVGLSSPSASASPVMYSVPGTPLHGIRPPADRSRAYATPARARSVQRLWLP